MAVKARLGMHGALRMRVIRAKPTVRRRLLDAIASFLRRI